MENNEGLPEVQTKLINGVELSNVDIAKISMICDYLIVDHFHDVSSFIRLERCFGPFFSKEDPNFLPSVHREICGPKKKYITYGRLIAAYAKWKSKSSTNESFNKFMDLVFGDMIKTQVEVVGKLVEGGRIFSTRNTRGRKVISKFSVITDETKNQIGGFHIQYDDVFDSVLSPKKTKEGISLEMNFPPNGREIRDRDGISHIGGKYSITKDIIKFLVFKCRSGKTFYIGDVSEDEGEKFELFLFGTSSCQLKSVRVEVINNQLTYFEPKFQPSLRVNTKLKDFDSIDEKFIEENITNAPFIFEENEMQKLSEEQLQENNMLLIPCISDDAFVDKNSLIEPIFGRDFNEIYKSFLVSQSEQTEQEKEELKKKVYEKTIMRKHLLKIYFKKFKVTENISVLKAPKQPESRIKMDKFLAKVKGYRKRMNKKIEQKKEEAQKATNEEDSFWNDDEEDWPEDKNLESDENNQKEQPKEEKVQKDEEPPKEGQTEPKEEESKKEETKEPKEEEPKKEESLKVGEVKVEIEPPKVEEVKVEVEPPKIEEESKKEDIKVGIEPPKVDEIKVESQKEEDMKNEILGEEKIVIDVSNEKEKQEEPQVEKIELKGKPRKLLNKLNKTKINPEEPKQEEPKQEEPKKEEPKQEEPKQEESKQEESKQEEQKQEEPKKEEPKQEEPKKEEPKQEEPKKEEPKQEEPKKEEPKKEEPKKEEPKKEEPKKEEPKKEEPKKEEPKKEEPKKEEIKKEETKKEEIKKVEEPIKEEAQKAENIQKTEEVKKEVAFEPEKEKVDEKVENKPLTTLNDIISPDNTEQKNSS